MGERLRLTRVALGLVLVALTFSAWVWLQPGGPRAVLVRWFGPPQVELGEAYAPDRGAQIFDHSAFDALLGSFVDEHGFVDYLGLGRRQADLDRYLELLAAAPFEELGRDEKLALWIDAYNAFTLKLILEHYPLDSIRDIPSAERWERVRWNVAGNEYSLNQIEHEQIRPKFREPRIHFALVCAAVGCPPLRREAFVGARLDEQLEDQARRVHRYERWIRYTSGADRIELTSLYEWYGGDFEQVAGSVIDYAARHRPDLAADLESGHRPTPRFLDYDWSLNRQPGAER
jgi:hypothetical protein